MYDLSFTLLLLGGGVCVCVLVWFLKIDFELFFQSLQLVMVRKKILNSNEKKKAFAKGNKD